MKETVVHEIFLMRCLQLASNGEGNTYPNPLVGSVIVHKEKIIGEGFHWKAGEPHAEVNAINSVKDKSLLSKSTLYVNLEPCAHFGKTPPCSLLIINHKIPKVIIGCIDSYSEVSGKGIEMMRSAGIDVVTGVLEKESRFINRRFFTFHEKKRPYVILKWAETTDGFIDVERFDNNESAIQSPSLREGLGEGFSPQPTWITNEWARRAVHKQRGIEQAVLVGTNTALMDNPSLTLRDWDGNPPTRIVIDRQLKLPKKLNLFVGKAKTIVLNEINEGQKENITHLKISLQDDAAQNILTAIFNQQLQSVIIEGGRTTLDLFLKSGLWDEAHVYIGNKLFKAGVKAPETRGDLYYKKEFGDSKLFVYRNML